MSLYSQYLFEKEGIETLETDKGFVTYKMIDPETVYLMDIYVIPEERRYHVATDLANQVIEKTLANYVLGSINPDNNNSHESLLVLLGYGMTLWKVENGLIFFQKEVK